MAKMAERYDECPLAIHVLDAYGASREVARCDDDALAFTLRTLVEEGQINETNDVGVLDRESCSWLINPYAVTPLGRMVALGKAMVE